MASVSALVDAAASGDQETWNALVARFNGLVWSVAAAHMLAPPDELEGPAVDTGVDEGQAGSSIG